MSANPPRPSWYEVPEDPEPWADPLQQLIRTSAQTLNAFLNREDIPIQERAALALKVLELSGVSAHLPTAESNSNEPMRLDLPDSPVGVSALVNREDRPPPSQSMSIQLPTLSPEVTLDRPVASDLLSPQVVMMDNFLSPETSAQALAIALNHEADFTGSTTTTGVIDYRKSSVLYATFFPELYEHLRQRIMQVLPSVLQALNHSSFAVSEVEMQLTAHNDGCYYKVHNDSGSEATATREITYVYYFYRQPKAFSGGELRLYETDLRGGWSPQQRAAKTLTPRHNSIVFFDSRCDHEVMPVHCPSQMFADSRFTLNGWLRR